MSQVDFGESKNNTFSPVYQNPETKGMVGLLIKWGVTDDVKIANFILLGMSLFLFGASVYLSYSFIFPPKVSVQLTDESNNPLRQRIDQNAQVRTQ
jgi:hypothetical protein